MPENQSHQTELAATVQKLGADMQTMRGSTAALMQDLGDRVDENTALTAGLTIKVDALTASNAETRADNLELLEIFRAVRGTLRVLGWLGKALQWILPIVGGVIGIIYATKGGGGGPHQ